jgi:hypothetical protein
MELERFRKFLSRPHSPDLIRLSARSGAVLEEMPTEQIVKVAISGIDQRLRRLGHFPYLSVLCNQT